jgi:hypothetical protein
VPFAVSYNPVHQHSFIIASINHTAIVTNLTSKLKMPSYALVCLSALLSLASAVNFTDKNVLPTPVDTYSRYLTLYGQGTRTYACDRTPGSTNFTLININNDLYRAEPKLNLTTLVGRRVYLASPDYDDGAFAFYTKEGAFAYWYAYVRTSRRQ